MKQKTKTSHSNIKNIKNTKPEVKVELTVNGGVSISTHQFSSPLIQYWLEPFKISKVKGEVFYCPEEEALCFKPYTASKQQAPKVKQKCLVSKTQVALYKDKLKLSLSLPLSMNNEEMSVTLLEEYYLVAKAIMLDLRKALELGSLKKEYESKYA